MNKSVENSWHQKLSHSRNDSHPPYIPSHKPDITWYSLPFLWSPDEQGVGTQVKCSVTWHCHHHFQVRKSVGPVSCSKSNSHLTPTPLDFILVLFFFSTFVFCTISSSNGFLPCPHDPVNSYMARPCDSHLSLIVYTAKNKMFAKWICSDWLIHESTNFSSYEMRKRKWSLPHVFSKSAFSAPGWLPWTATGSSWGACLGQL